MTAALRSDRWVAMPGSQALYLACPARECLYHGSRGAAKTDALLMDFAQHVGLGFGAFWRGVVFRQTYKQLDDLLTKSRRWFRAIWGDRARFVGGEQFKWVWESGEELLFRRFDKPDDYWNYHGHEYPFIGWEELTNWVTLDGYDRMKACNRSSHPGVPRKVRATTNPWGRGHNAVKRRFVDAGAEGAIVVDALSPGGRTHVGGRLEENLALNAADPEYRSVVASVSSEALRKAWLLGSWDISAGGMFDDLWTPGRHLVAPFEPPRSWRVDRSFDWGSAHPFSVGWWAEATEEPARLADGHAHVFPAGSLFRLSEWYGWDGTDNSGSRMLASRIADGIVAREAEMLIADRCDPGPADPSIWNEQNGMCIARDMRERGVDFVPANNDRKSGWELTRVRLGASVPEPGQPQPEDAGLYVMDRTLLPPGSPAGLRRFGDCEQFKRVFPYAPRKPSDMDDVDTDSEDHIADEVRYRVMAAALVVTQVDSYANRQRRH